MNRRAWPYVVDVPSIVPGFGGLRFLVDSPADCVERIEYLLTLVHDAGDGWMSNTGVLLRCITAHHGVDALLDAMLEIERQVADGEIEAWWCESWPGTAPPEWPAEVGQDSGVAA